MQYQINRIRSTALLVVVMACGAKLASGQPGTSTEQNFPDVLAAKVRPIGDISFDFDVTISSPYDTPSRYADGFRVVSTSGTVFGERKLWHDHPR